LLLQQVAQRLETCVREGDTVARLGGDEFVVLLEDLSKETLDAAAQAEGIGEKILFTLNQLYYLGTFEYRNTPSIGVTLFNNQQQACEELFKQADLAMYQAKKAGRNSLSFFDPQMQESINARSSLEAELHKAIKKQEFHLYYQVQVDSAGRPFGAEALIRWIHPERGLVPPVQFIPLAEESGLILPIGQWVLETACEQIKVWQRHEATRNLVLSINVSARQFHQTNFVTEVQVAMQRHDINPQLLKLELTESMLLEKVEETIATMNALKAIGVRISLDDFGTGYSSLQYLKRLPLTQLKIDQSFVREVVLDESDKAIVRTIIALAHGLKLNVIAEGVETDAQRQFLDSAGCHHYQGYLFGKPVSIEQFELFLKQS
jgi:predicted signal transduction protein with EAL and GGDEF domain